MIQLANITRDVERDLVPRHRLPPLAVPHLGTTDAAGPVREARRHLMAHALAHAPAYTRLAEQIAPSRFSLARGLSRPHAPPHGPPLPVVRRRIGHPDWRGPDRAGTIVLASLLAAFSCRWSHRVMRRVEQDFLSAVQSI